MSQIVHATFEDGVLKPHEDLGLKSGTTVQIVVVARREPAGNAFAELEWFRTQNPIDSHGSRLTRDQLHERC